MFSARHGFDKPNDRRALDLMNAAARGAIQELPEVVVAYGVSDEYSFAFHSSCQLFDRRASKLVTTVVSTFTAYYVHLWQDFFPNNKLTAPLPSFDGRAVTYPSVTNFRDYMSWRQADCHINNLYNTTFWALIQRGSMNAKEAEQLLQGTLSSNKNEILFSRFGINYNDEPDIFKKGSVVFREYEESVVTPTTSTADTGSERVESFGKGEKSGVGPDNRSKSAVEKDRKTRSKAQVVVKHVDIIRDDFWIRHPWILSGRVGKLPIKT